MVSTVRIKQTIEKIAPDYLSKLSLVQRTLTALGLKDERIGSGNHVSHELATYLRDFGKSSDKDTRVFEAAEQVAKQEGIDPSVAIFLASLALYKNSEAQRVNLGVS